MSEEIVLFTGGFDPLHSGHIEAIKHAQQFGRVVIGLNSDEWLTRKKGKPFMSFEERKTILDNLKGILTVISFDDSDGSACDAIRQCREMFPKSKLVFVNGGDRTANNIPEMDAFKNDQTVKFIFEVGGCDKKNSSSWILKDWKSPETERLWGSYLNYYDTKNVKVKRLILKPGKSISMQYHLKRSEFWFIESGEGCLYTIVQEKEDEIVSRGLKQHDFVNIDVGSWHRLENIGALDLCVIEIQYGEDCSEEDIVRA